MIDVGYDMFRRFIVLRLLNRFRKLLGLKQKVYFFGTERVGLAVLDSRVECMGVIKRKNA